MVVCACRLHRHLPVLLDGERCTQIHNGFQFRCFSQRCSILHSSCQLNWKPESKTLIAVLCRLRPFFSRCLTTSFRGKQELDYQSARRQSLCRCSFNLGSLFCCNQKTCCLSSADSGLYKNDFWLRPDLYFCGFASYGWTSQLNKPDQNWGLSKFGLLRFYRLCVLLQHVNHGCGENRTGQTAVYIYLILVICLICSYYILGEKLTVWSASGAFLVLFGLVLSQLDSSVLKKKFLKAWKPLSSKNLKNSSKMQKGLFTKLAPSTNFRKSPSALECSQASLSISSASATARWAASLKKDS